MKSLILIALFAFSSLAFAERSAAYITGDKIHFQEASSYISAYYNRTLCKSDDTFFATGRKCVKWGGREGDYCREWRTTTITQPITSERQRCKKSNGRSGECREWETIRYHQSPTRVVSFWSARDHLIKTETITVPDCN